MDTDRLGRSMTREGLEDEDIDYLTDILQEMSTNNIEDEDSEFRLVLQTSLSELSLKDDRLADRIINNYLNNIDKDLIDDPIEYLDSNQCELCERYTKLTIHHLLPKSEHKRLISRGLFNKFQCDNLTVRICRNCHNACHQYLSNKQLADFYNSIDKLLSNENIFKLVKFNSKG